MSLDSVGSAKAKMLAAKDSGKSLQQRSLRKLSKTTQSGRKCFF